MSAFKKKTGVSQQPKSIQQMQNKLNLLLGLGSSQSDSMLESSSVAQPQRKNGQLNRDLILACANFWDSKKRIDKIKSLMLKQQQLDEFNDTQDFQVSQLMSIQLLSLSRNSIMHLQPLSVLDTLVCLNINYNKIYDLSPLQTLINLQQLYCSNNQISHIDPLKPLNKIRILNMYSNKVNRLDETIAILQVLSQLQQLDIQQNPVYTQQSRRKFLTLKKIARLNGQLVLQQQRQNLGVSSTSIVVMPTAKFRDTHTSFFNKSQVNTNISFNSSNKQSKNNAKFSSKLQLAQSIKQLQKKYFDIDDKFESQIVINVQLKSKYQQQAQNKKNLQRKVLDIKYKQQEIKQLKRKVKMLKQTLFGQGMGTKAELLRQLFQLQILSQTKKNTNSNKDTDKVANNNEDWARKFDYDQQIFVKQSTDNKYLFDDDEQIEMLLNDNNSALQQLKKELREITK